MFSCNALYDCYICCHSAVIFCACAYLDLSVCLSVCVSLSLSLSFALSACLTAYIREWLHMFLTVSLFVYHWAPPTSLPVCVCVRAPGILYVCVCVCVYVWLFFPCPICVLPVAPVYDLHVDRSIMLCYYTKSRLAEHSTVSTILTSCALLST